jgi:hypothetical protein
VILEFYRRAMKLDFYSGFSEEQLNLVINLSTTFLTLFALNRVLSDSSESHIEVQPEKDDLRFRLVPS